MIYKSLWLKNIKEKLLPPLKNNIDTDVLIIGGGITGITTAYFLKDSNLKVTLVDQSRIGFGHTAHSTGKLTYLQNSNLLEIEKAYDKDTVKKYIESQKEAMDIVKEIIIDNNIKCDYESNNSYIFTNKKSSISNIKKVGKLLDYSNIKYKIFDNLPRSFPCIYSLKTDDSSVFNPLKYVLELKRICQNKINIYENTKIINIEENDNSYIAYTDKYKINAKKIILACSYPMFIKPYFFPFKTEIKKGYLCASNINKPRRFNAISDDDNIQSIRYHSDTKDYIIYCGEERTLGSNMDNEKNYDNLFWKMKSTLSDKIKYAWFNYDIYTKDYLPLIGKLEKDKDNLLIGTGYNAWGLTNGTIAGKILSDIIKNNDNKYIDLFSPCRDFTINEIPNYVEYNIKTGYNYVTSKIKDNYSFYKTAKVIEKDGTKYGIYTDEENKQHIVYNKCPHMKCDLVFNEIDKTWDCPCHGSRFDINGKVVFGPSTYNISIEKNK